MRDAIGQLPDGRYEHMVDSDGFTDPVRLKLAADVRGDQIVLDFDGSAPQSEHGINLVLNYTRAYASFAMKAAVAPEVPHNAGSFRPVDVKAPEGSILNCRAPAPVASRHLIGHLLPGLIFGALEPALEGRLLASGADSIWITVWRGERPRTRSSFNITMFQSGGMGARRGKDGLNATGFPAAVAAVPTEVIETTTDLVQHERALLTDSGGAGRWRGGLGQRSRVSSRSGLPWSVSVLAERTEHAAPGLDGGEPGARGSISVDGRPAPAKRLTRLSPGATVQLDLPGAGGVGNPRERAPDDVIADVADGYISIETAAELYGLKLRCTAPADSLVRTPEDYEQEEQIERE